MRLFVALLPAPAAAAELAAALAPLHALPHAGRLRWTEPEGWHFTLAFLGEVPDTVRPELEERLGRAARRHGPYAMRLAGGGRFGDRALWTGAECDLADLARLADSVRAVARRAGAPADEEHGFTPHLTLARTPRTGHVALRPFADALAGFRGAPWTAGTLSLVASIPPAPGVPGAQPHYEPVAGWRLGGGPADGPGAGPGAGPDTAAG
jgi:RNA 2',3'-cyclic 3'-phosphodiesterase